MTATAQPLARSNPLRPLVEIFVRVGVLPYFLVIALAVFAVISDNYFTVGNLTNVLRQSAFLVVVTVGQMVVLVTGGFDLAVGTTAAMTSVVTGWMLTAFAGSMALGVAIPLGLAIGLGVGVVIGLVNGFGVSIGGVNPFIMTFGVAAILQGLALWSTGGVPVRGLPQEFADFLGFGSFLGLGTSVWVALIVVAVAAVLVHGSRHGRYLFAVGSSDRAAALSGVPVNGTLIKAYVMSGLLAALAGILITARTNTGEATIGADLPLESIAACVIGGVSLRGGVGSLPQAVLGALFIQMVRNGLNLARIDANRQLMVIGVLVVLAVVLDQLRGRMRESA